MSRLIMSGCRLLRGLFGIDNSQYILSICGDQALREMPSPGKSGRCSAEVPHHLIGGARGTHGCGLEAVSRLLGVAAAAALGLCCRMAERAPS